jgi:PAT family beta-lactamase induction signal transducer AmpG
VLFLLAYASATHDIACDGLYMGALDEKRQAAYAGWQGAFFNARLPHRVVLVLAGGLEGQMGVFNAWSAIFALLACCWRCWPPGRQGACPTRSSGGRAGEAARGVADFLRKPGIWKGALHRAVPLRRGPGADHRPAVPDRGARQGGLGLTTGRWPRLRHGGHGAFLVGSVLGGYFTSRLACAARCRC